MDLPEKGATTGFSRHRSAAATGIVSPWADTLFRFLPPHVTSDDGQHAMKRSKVGILSLLLVAGLGACDDATGPGDSLTQAEAEALAQVILTQTFAAGDPTGEAGPPAAAPVARQVTDFSNEVTVELPCPLGGTVTAAVEASGTVDSQTGATDLLYASTQTHRNCQVQPEDAENPFTLNGAPSINSSFEFTSDGSGAFQTDGSIVGSVEWSSGERAGTCVISLEFSGSADDQGGVSFSVTGGVCSARISQTVSVTA